MELLTQASFQGTAPRNMPNNSGTSPTRSLTPRGLVSVWPRSSCEARQPGAELAPSSMLQTQLGPTAFEALFKSRPCAPPSGQSWVFSSGPVRHALLGVSLGVPGSLSFLFKNYYFSILQLQLTYNITLGSGVQPVIRHSRTSEVITLTHLVPTGHHPQ